MGVVLLLAAGGAYVYFYEPDSVRKVLGNTPFAPAVARAYKWQGKDGGWHITSSPPPEGIAFEIMTVRTDANIVPATPTKPKN